MTPVAGPWRPEPGSTGANVESVGSGDPEPMPVLGRLGVTDQSAFAGPSDGGLFVIERVGAWTALSGGHHGGSKPLLVRLSGPVAG